MSLPCDEEKDFECVEFADSETNVGRLFFPRKKSRYGEGFDCLNEQGVYFLAERVAVGLWEFGVVFDPQEICTFEPLEDWQKLAGGG